MGKISYKNIKILKIDVYNFKESCTRRIKIQRIIKKNIKIHLKVILILINRTKIFSWWCFWAKENIILDDES